jgi:hypothetical protein
VRRLLQFGRIGQELAQVEQALGELRHFDDTAYGHWLVGGFHGLGGGVVALQRAVAQEAQPRRSEFSARTPKISGDFFFC